MDSVQKQLEELGLSANEVKVYTASLEIGAATAQQLAAKAAVVRPTAYVAIGGLVKRGLMSSHTRGKKQFFQAERPAQLLRLVEEEKKKLSERESKLKSLLPGLESLISVTGEKMEVKYYDGWDGLKILQKTLIDSGVKSFDVMMFQSVAIVGYNKLPADKSVNYNLDLNAKRISKRQLMIGDPRRLKTWRPFVKNLRSQYKVLSSNDTKTSSEVAIFGDYIVLVSYAEVPHGCIIKNTDTAKLAKIMFDTIWNSNAAKNLHPR
ncbi:MAG: helix-turn-helix domain-containing protein [Patescibacteria group bacterium]|jgi:sugar-specific transcriptional regulator TrmB